MPDRPDRRVSLALALPDGTPLGIAHEFAVPGATYWPGARTVAAAAATAWGSSERPVILRLADVRPADDTGAERVVYTAEVTRPPDVPLSQADPSLFIDEPLRMPSARPGGAVARLGWTLAQLASIGMPQTGAAEQIHTWNLSSLWWIPTAEGIA